MPDDNHLIKNFGLKAGCVWTISFVLFIIGIYSDLHTKSIWIIILFLIPFAVQFRGLYILYRRYDEQNIANAVFSDFYLITMAICLMSYSIFWLSYINWKNKFKWEDEVTWKIEDNTTVFLIYFLSIVALVVILILLLLVVRMTRAVIQGDGSKIPVHSSVFGETKRRRGDIWNLDYLRAGASQEPFLSLVFFFTVFLVISYLFGFAFGFHDKSQPFNNPALYMKNLYLSQPNTSPKVSEGTYYSFNLENGKAIPELEKNKSNETSMNNLITSIEAATEGDNKVCAVVTGYANKRETKGTAYQSNYELGEARAQNIKYEAQRKLYSKEDKKWRNVEWVCLSKSNESLSESKAVVKVNLLATPMDPASLSVSHTKADHQNPLSLMDYVYFANYTITTTGYGDIVPNTVYAKFICTCANICEVFFLVVFFNALLSLKENKQEQVFSTKLNEISEKLNKITNEN